MALLKKSINDAEIKNLVKSIKLLKEKGNFSNDKIDGIIKQYNESGNLLYEANFNQGIKNGTEREFFPSGKTNKEFQYKNGKQDGLCKEYYENGNIKSEITMRNDKEHGPFKSYFENGNIEFSGTTDSSSLAKSNLIGELIQYNEDGNIKRVSPSKPLEAVRAMISLIAKVN